MEQPEIHPPHHPHGGLPRWLEWVTSVSALVVSVTSIVIAVHSSATMEKLVQANSLPYLEGGTSNATQDGLQQRMSLDLVNHGVGPAHEQSLTIQVGDRYARSVDDLVRLAVGPAEAADARRALHVYFNGVRTRFIPANYSQFVFSSIRTDANARYWDLVDKSRARWKIEFCYCSVFKECWRVNDEHHEPVARCVRNESHEFLP